MPEFAPLRDADLPRAAALSALIGWNQTEADWRLFLHHGAVRALDDGDAAALAATAAVLPYGPGVAWISMVLVRSGPPPCGAGDGADALGGRASAGGAPALHRAGRNAGGAGGLSPARLPRPLGIRALGPARCAARRARRRGAPPERAAEWPALLALDAAAFGAPREFLLRDFAARCPDAALVVGDAGGGLRGALLARDGVRGPQLGPLYAADAAAARALLAAGLAARPGAVLDLHVGDPHGLHAWLQAHGGAVQRPFTRMALGADPPGDPDRILAVAGPEFG